MQPAQAISQSSSQGVPLGRLPPFAEIFAQHAPYVWRVLRRLGVPASDVEDVCQDVFMVVHRKLPGFDGRSSLRTWIYGICINTASDHRRKAHVRREQVTDSPPEELSQATPDQALDQQRALAALDAILNQLDDEKRAVFVLYEIEQLPMNEVALAVGCPLQTAYSRLHAARKWVEDAVARSGRRNS